jgi:hypothetical protein
MIQIRRVTPTQSGNRFFGQDHAQSKNKEAVDDEVDAVRVKEMRQTKL